MRRLRYLAVVALGAVLAAACGSTPEVAQTTELVIKSEPAIVLPRQLVAIDLDGDGHETVVLSAEGSSDLDGEIVEYMWSQGLEDFALTKTHTREFAVGEHVVTLTITDDDGLSDVQSLVVRVLEPYSATENSPVIDLWLGSSFEAGLGDAERWVNVLGNVSDPDGVSSLTWSLNGGQVGSLAFVPDDRRLAGAGDFTLDMLRDTLVPGTNTVELRAIDTRGEMTTALVQIEYTEGPPPALPVQVDWQEGMTLDGIVEVIDGHWQVMNGEAVIDAGSRGYDRLLAIGDTSWTDFDVTTTVVIDGLAPMDERSPFSNTPGFGMLLRWNGHTDVEPSGFQPQAGFRPDGGVNPTPYGGFPFFTWDVTGGVFEMQNHRSAVITNDPGVSIDFGRRYHFRSQVQSRSGGAVYRSKIWADGNAEPAGWNVSYVAGQSEFEPPSGSLVLVAHEVEARFGPVTISPISADERLSDEQIAALQLGEL